LTEKIMTRDVLIVLMSVALVCAYSPSAVANSQLNFKIYPPSSATDNSNNSSSAAAADKFTIHTPPVSNDGAQTPAPPEPIAPATSDAPISSDPAVAQKSEPGPAADSTPVEKAQAAPATADSAPINPPIDPAINQAINPPILQSETPQSAAMTGTASQPANPAVDNTLTPSEMNATNPAAGTDATNTAAATTPAATDATAAPPAAASQTVSADSATPEGGAADKTQIASKVLQGYVHVVPTGTKIPIIMDTAVDSDTSQEGDEFEARTAEDLTIDGTIAVPAGSVIKGRIATLAAPKRLQRPGSVALKFDTVTTPDSRQIQLVANLVARGGVVHARRGMRDIAIDTGIFALPAVAGLAIGAVAGNSAKSLGIGGGALIGVGIGAAVGVAVLLAKKGKRIDVRPGDELKIELAEDLRMPTM
jgi:hypothetical protein